MSPRTAAVGLAALIVSAVGVLALLPTPEPPTTAYATCDQARSTGPTPIREGSDGYAPHLDADRDGLACE